MTIISESPITQKKIRLLLADSHSILRNGLKLLLEKDASFEIVSEAKNAEEVLQQLKKSSAYDIILADLDIAISGNCSLIGNIKMHYPQLKFIMLSADEQEKNVRETFLHAGDGYLLKNISLEELIFALKFIFQGNRYISSAASFSFFNNLWRNRTHLATSISSTLDFNEREREVLQLIAMGLTNIEIGNQLFLSKRTIEGHRQSLLEKTGSKNSAALVRYGLVNGLID